MLIRPENEQKLFAYKPQLKIFGSIVVLLIFLQLIYVIFFAHTSSEINKEIAASVNAGTVEAIGRELFTNYVLPFEITGYMLLAAAIGALVLAKKKFE
jgi:NADH-quinone oxidoreductase subunit J